MDIGFIGLGRMGSAMARNLAGAPHAVTGFDSAGTTVDGVQVASSPAEAADIGLITVAADDVDDRQDDVVLLDTVGILPVEVVDVSFNRCLI